MSARLLCPAVTLIVSLSLFAAETVELRPARIPSCEGCYSQFADFNGDGLDDVITTSKLQFNLGGRFGPVIEVGGGPVWSRLTDFNHDGFADMVVEYDPSGRGADHILIGNGAGGFTDVDFSREGGDIIQLADFTGDGNVDLIQLRVTPVSQHVTLLRGNGNATFTPHQTFAWPHQINVDGDPIGVGDLNGDGRPDLVFNHDRYLDFLFAQADGTYGAPVTRFTNLGIRPVKVVDMNSDGENDVVFMDVHHDPGVSVLFGDGTGRFPAHTRIGVPDDRLSERDPQNIVIEDFVPGGGNEIAMALASREIMMFGVADGQLRELGRTPIEGMLHRVNAVRFRSTTPELVVSGNARDHTQTPWVGASWVVDVTGTVDAPARRGRSRAMGRGLAVASGTYDLTVVSNKCGVQGLQTWTIEREGLFVNFAPSPQVERVESVVLDGQLFVRLLMNEGGRTRVLEGELKPTATGLAGNLVEWGDQAACAGLLVHKVDARLRTQ